MTDQSTSHKSFKDRIPPDAREHLKAAREEMRKGIEALLPEGFMKHRHTARKEMLMAWRSMIDAAIEKTDERIK
jgi:hypothetical protein